MFALLNLIDTVIWLYTLVLLVHIVLSWLTAFNVVNARHPFVNALQRIAYDPALFAGQDVMKVAPLLTVGIGLALRRQGDKK